MVLTEEVIIHAPQQVVWAVVGDFNGEHRWHPAVRHSEIVAGRNNRPGAVRVLTLSNGDTIRQTLLSYDPKRMRMKWRTDDPGRLAMRDHEATLSVIYWYAKDRTKVEIQSRFRRKDPSPQPNPNYGDAAASRLVDRGMQQGLYNLKRMIEGR